MIEFNKYKFSNGFMVIYYYDLMMLMVVVNMLYDVGVCDELELKIGFVYLFEYFMFGGFVNIVDFDVLLQYVGGELNVFMFNDIINYYDVFFV